MKLSPNKMQLAMANACITIGNLAKVSNVSRVTLTKFISGKSNPKPATVGKIAKALNVSVEELIEDTAATVNQYSTNSGVRG